MKKSCNKCHANRTNFCGLDYETEVLDKVFKDYSYTELKPLEECPKPITYSKYIKLWRELKRS